jgi:hypothetical protein
MPTTTLTPASPINFKESASQLVSKGFSVIPLQPNSKAPLVGATARSRDLGQVEAWANAHPNANVGLVADDNFTLLETDDESTLLAEFAKLGVTIPKTTKLGSGRPNRGCWIFKRTPQCGDDCLVVPGVFEFRNRNQYVVAPGSNHPNGLRYRWFDESTPVEMPDELIAALRKLDSGYRGASGAKNIKTGPAAVLRDAYLKSCNPEDMLGCDVTISENERHYTLLSIAGVLNDGNRSAEEIAEHLIKIRDKYCVVGSREIGDDEIARLAGYVTQLKPFIAEPWDVPAFAVGLKAFSDPESYEAAAKESEEKGQLADLLPGDRATFNPWDYALAPLPDQKYSGWFPRGRITLVSGASGSMKTTFVTQVLFAARENQTFLGHVGTGKSFIELFADRGKYDAQETFDRMNLTDRIPFRCINGLGCEASLKAIARAAKEYAVVFIDGGDLLVADNNDGTNVGVFMTGLQRVAEHFGTALIVSTGAGKMSPKALKEGAERRTITKGSEVWGRCGGSLFTLNSEGHDGTKATRRLVVQHRNAATEKYLLEMVDGQLSQVDEVAVQERAATNKTLDWIAGQDRFTFNQFKTGTRCSGAAAKNRLKGLVDTGLIRKHGVDGKVWYSVERDRDSGGTTQEGLGPDKKVVPLDQSLGQSLRDLSTFEINAVTQTPLGPPHRESLVPPRAFRDQGLAPRTAKETDLERICREVGELAGGGR